MKVVQVTPYFLPKIGGIENYVSRLSYELRKKGWDVKIITTGFEKNRENVIYLRPVFSILRNPIPFGLKKILENEKADIFHLHSHWFIISYLSTKYIPKKFPIVLTSHSADIPPKNILTKTLRFFYFKFAKKVLENSRKIIALTQSEKKKLIDIFGLKEEKIEVIPNGIYFKDFKKCLNKNEFYEKYSLSEDTFKILFVSRIVPEKRPYLLAEAAKFLPSDVEILFVGPGDEKLIKKLSSISTNIKFFGSIPFKDLVSFYHYSDLFVFLGTWEGLPTVILEAMACGLPILSVDVGGVREVILQVKGNKIIKPTMNELISSILYFYKNRDMAKKVGARNKELVKKKYEWKSISQQIIKIYKEII